MHVKKFTKEQRSTFSYWYYHWKAFNHTAWKLDAWKIRYLFHDIEKPWLKLALHDYSKVQRIVDGQSYVVDQYGDLHNCYV